MLDPSRNLPPTARTPALPRTAFPSRCAPSTDSTPTPRATSSANRRSRCALSASDPHGVSDEQVVHAGPGECLGLVDRGHRQPARAGPKLAVGDLRALVALGVWTQGEPLGPPSLSHPRDVSVQHIRIDH